MSDLAARAAKLQQAMADRQRALDATTAVTALAQKSSTPLCAAVPMPVPADDKVQSGKVKSAKQLLREQKTAVKKAPIAFATHLVPGPTRRLSSQTAFKADSAAQPVADSPSSTVSAPPASSFAQPPFPPSPPVPPIITFSPPLLATPLAAQSPVLIQAVSGAAAPFVASVAQSSRVGKAAVDQQKQPWQPVAAAVSAANQSGNVSGSAHKDVLLPQTTAGGEDTHAIQSFCLSLAGCILPESHLSSQALQAVAGPSASLASGCVATSGGPHISASLRWQLNLKPWTLWGQQQLGVMSMLLLLPHVLCGRVRSMLIAWGFGNQCIKAVWSFLLILLLLGAFVHVSSSQRALCHR